MRNIRRLSLALCASLSTLAHAQTDTSRSSTMVLSECAQSHEPLRLRVALTGPEQSEWLFHCLVPAAKWWDDLVFT